MSTDKRLATNWHYAVSIEYKLDTSNEAAVSKFCDALWIELESRYAKDIAISAGDGAIQVNLLATGESAGEAADQAGSLVERALRATTHEVGTEAPLFGDFLSMVIEPS